MIRRLIGITLGIYSLIAPHPEGTGGDRDHANRFAGALGTAGEFGIADAARTTATVIAALMAGAVGNAFLGAAETDGNATVQRIVVVAIRYTEG
jgi:hypothetical protein